MCGPPISLAFTVENLSQAEQKSESGRAEAACQRAHIQYSEAGFRLLKRRVQWLSELEMWLSAGRMLVCNAHNPGFEPSAVELSVVAHARYPRHGDSGLGLVLNVSRKNNKNTS